MWFGLCNLSYGVGTGDGFFVLVGGKWLGSGMGNGRTVSWSRMCSIFM